MTKAHPRPWPGQECGDAVGTVAGYARHQRAQQDACGPCAKAWANYSREQREKHAEGPPLPDDHYAHGTIHGYNTLGCRCDACKRAINDYQRERQQRIKAEGLPPDHHAHGSAYAYRNYGCRCDRCRAAVTRYERERRESALESTRRKPGRPKTTGTTPTRSMRLGDVYDKAKAKAEANGETITAVVERLLAAYVNEGEQP